VCPPATTTTTTTTMTETTAPTRAQENKLEVVEDAQIGEMETGVPKKTRLGMVLSGIIRQTLRREEKFMDKIRESRVRWFGHVYKRDSGYIGQKAILALMVSGQLVRMCRIERVGGRDWSSG